jgi:hypothetical protein
MKGVACKSWPGLGRCPPPAGLRLRGQPSATTRGQRAIGSAPGGESGRLPVRLSPARSPLGQPFSEHGQRYPALRGRTRAPMPRIFLQPPASCQRFRLGRRLTGTASRLEPTKEGSAASRAAPADRRDCLSFQPPASCQRFRLGRRLTGTASRLEPTKEGSVASRAAPADRRAWLSFQPPAPCRRFRLGKRLTGTASGLKPTKERSVASRAAPADTHACRSFPRVCTVPFTYPRPRGRPSGPPSTRGQVPEAGPRPWS